MVGVRRTSQDFARGAGLPRYIATVETTKHRVFQFLPTSVLPEHKLVAIALDDAFSLGVLSSQLHVCWALATGGTLEDRPGLQQIHAASTLSPSPTKTPA
jgi:hypothetical protein